MAVHNFRKLKIYQRAVMLATRVYLITGRLPREEEFGLCSQMRRAAVSVVLNIAEGSGGSSDRELIRFLEMARRSLYELLACAEICIELAALPCSECLSLSTEADELAAMISGFRSRIAGK